MQKFKRRQRRSLPFGLFLAALGALLLPAAVAPRANAGSTDYSDFENPVGSASARAQGVLINQPLASNYNSSLALNVASGDQPGGFQPLAPLATFTWNGGGAPSVLWSTGTNWGGVAPTSSNTTDLIFAGTTNIGTAGTPLNQDIAVGMVINSITFSPGGGAFFLGGSSLRFDGGASNSITQSSSSAESIANNFLAPATNALNTITLTGNGTGVVTLSGVISNGAGARDYAIVKSGTSTFVLSGNNSYGGGTTVNGGTLLVNGAGDLGTGTVVVNSGTTLGGNSTATFNSGRITVAAGGNFSPGNGGNTIGNITVGALTLSAGANFRVDLNGIGQGTTYDFVTGAGGGATNLSIGGSNLVVHVGFAVAMGNTFTIMHNGGGYGGQQFASGTTVVADNGDVFSIAYTADNIVLTFTGTVVPEPSTWMGGALAIAGLAFTQRRRLRKLIVFSR